MPVSYGFLSTFPPTECGLATFTAALMGELQGGPAPTAVGVVRVVERVPQNERPEVVHHLVATSPGGEREAAGLLSSFDVVIVQHEYGIYGGPDGNQVVPVLEQVSSPVIVVLHTVLTDPTPHQHEVLERVIAAADAVVVMTPTARRRLLQGYRVDPARVALIPHGAADNRPRPAAGWPAGPRPAQPTILTWGLLGPGKGIEWGVDALAHLTDLEVAPRYSVVGETHPKVYDREGDAYRHSLRARAESLGVGDQLHFDARYLDSAALARAVQAADIVLLPYDSRDQVTSGVLVEALAAGKPVVATGFPHAIELLAGGAGVIVPHADGAAIAAALRRLLTDPALAARLGREASAIADGLLWPAVAEQYRLLSSEIIDAREGVAV